MRSVNSHVSLYLFSYWVFCPYELYLHPHPSSFPGSSVSLFFTAKLPSYPYDIAMFRFPLSWIWYMWKCRLWELCQPHSQCWWFRRLIKLEKCLNAYFKQNSSASLFFSGNGDFIWVRKASWDNMIAPSTRKQEEKYSSFPRRTLRRCA